MGLLSAADQERLRERFRRDDAARASAVLHADARLRDVPADAADSRRAAAAVRPDHDRGSELRPRAATRRQQYGIDRVPAIAIVGQDESGAERDSKIRFLGTPAGYEFISLVQAVLLVGGAAVARCPPRASRVVAAGRSPVTMHVFTTPTCPHCPRAVSARARDGVREPATSRPTPSRRRSFRTSPGATTSPACRRRSSTQRSRSLGDAADAIEILGALPPDDFVSQALASFSDDAARKRPTSGVRCRHAVLASSSRWRRGAGVSRGARPIALPLHVPRAGASLDAGRGDVHRI